MWLPGPVLFKIGPIPINTLGLAVGLAAFIGFWLVSREAKKEGISPDLILDLTLYAMIGGVLGARLWYVLFMWKEYVNNPLEILMVWHGGLAIQGGILGGILAGVWFAKRKGLPVWELSDMVAPALLLGMAIGRFADFLNGDAYGVPSNSFLAIRFPPGTYAYNVYGSTPILPMQLIEGIGDLMILGILIILKRKKSFPGFTFLLMLISYSILRFIVEFWRGDSLLLYHLKVAQLTALVTIFVGSVLIIRRWTKIRRRAVANGGSLTALNEER